MRLNGWQRIGIVALVALVAATSFAEATCGDSGGPGYRGPKGKCVGWEELHGDGGEGGVWCHCQRVDRVADVQDITPWPACRMLPDKRAFRRPVSCLLGTLRGKKT
jgi:hypothetical protein